MIKIKDEYLKKLTSNMNMRSMEIGKEIDGSTPPSIFIGSFNYPKVYAGPMMVNQHGDTAIMDLPESWIPGQKSQEDVINYRLKLIRGKSPVRINDFNNKLVGNLQEIALSSGSIESNAKFESSPKGANFSEDTTPFGPSAVLEKFDIGSVTWNKSLEKAFYDSDLLASDAVMGLHGKNVPFSSIQKAFSVGAFGEKKRRRLVPTRWSITACDTLIGKRLLDEVKHYDVIDSIRVHEFNSLNNHYAVLLMPSTWTFEWTEAFLRILGKEELIFSDFERNFGKKEYSKVGGCYYTSKMAVLEGLAREKKQASAIVLREAYTGYVPLGVFNVRENIRMAMNEKPKEFNDLGSAMDYISGNMKLPIKRFMDEGRLLRETVKGVGQRSLKDFL